jgi:hypothetical protein
MGDDRIGRIELRSSRLVSLIGVSGADGAGKTTLVSALSAVMAKRGVRTATVHLYGCFLCRHLPHLYLSRSLRPSAERPDQRRSRAVWFPLAALLSGHALLEAVELRLRLQLARWRLARDQRRRRGWRPAATPPFRACVLITDRSPLDALVKHSPYPASRTACAFLRSLARYDQVIWLDAPADVLAARDGEHAAAALTTTSQGFEAWANRLPAVVRIDSHRDPAAVLESLLHRLPDEVWRPEPA